MRPIGPVDDIRGRPKSGGHTVDKWASVPGYLVIESGAPWICGRPAIEGDAIVLAPGTLERYDIYERDSESLRTSRRELAFELAAVKNPSDACAVARRYGLLTRGLDSAEYREPFSLWETVAREAALILRLAVAVREKNVEQLQRLLDPWRKSLEEYESRDTVALASILIEGLLNDGLSNTKEAVVSAVRVTQGEWRGQSGRWFFAPQFESLVGYAFHRLAQTICYRLGDLFVCENCGKTRVRARGDQLYCDKRCSDTAKKRRYRARHGQGAGEAKDAAMSTTPRRE